MEPQTARDHGEHGQHGEHGRHEHPGGHQFGHGGRHGPQDAGDRDVVRGTIKAINGTTFVLSAGDEDVTVAATPETNFHGLPGRVVREAGHEKNSFALLRVGQQVGVMGRRGDGGVLAAERVHIAEI